VKVAPKLEKLLTSFQKGAGKAAKWGMWSDLEKATLKWQGICGN